MIVVLFEQSVYGETVRLGYLVLDQKWDPTQVLYTWAHHIQSSEYSQKGRQQVTSLSLRNLSKPSKETEYIDPRSVRLHSSGSQHCHLLVLASRFLLQFSATAMFSGRGRTANQSWGSGSTNQTSSEQRKLLGDINPEFLQYEDGAPIPRKLSR